MSCSRMFALDFFFCPLVRAIASTSGLFLERFLDFSTVYIWVQNFDFVSFCQGPFVTTPGTRVAALEILQMDPAI